MEVSKQALQNIISDETRLLFEENIPSEYLSDALGRRTGTADALVFALSTEEVSGVLRYANENGIPVTPRGAGTNLVGSTVPLDGGILLDLSRMNRVLELDEDTMLCKRKGPVRKDGCCRRFCYDPLRREPSPRRETLLSTDGLDFSL